MDASCQASTSSEIKAWETRHTRIQRNNQQGLKDQPENVHTWKQKAARSCTKPEDPGGQTDLQSKTKGDNPG
jgi:hypothetical protein